MWVLPVLKWHSAIVEWHSVFFKWHSAFVMWHFVIVGRYYVIVWWHLCLCGVSLLTGIMSQCLLMFEKIQRLLYA